MKDTEGGRQPALPDGLMQMGGVRGSSMGPVLGLRVLERMMVPDGEMEGK